MPICFGKDSHEARGAELFEGSIDAADLLQVEGGAQISSPIWLRSRFRAAARAFGCFDKTPQEAGSSWCIQGHWGCLLWWMLRVNYDIT